MATFELYRHRLLGAHDGLVKRGFSWPGFFFGWMWAASKQLWFQAAVLFILAPFAGVVPSRFLLALSGSTVKALTGWGFGELGLSFGLLGGFHLLVMLIVGFKGNQWRRERLLAMGYEYSGETTSPTADRAWQSLAFDAADNSKEVSYDV